MPGPPAQTSGSGQHGAYSAQVIHANSTLNAFVGGKQKAWMANATPVQPSPRPQPPPRPRTQQNQLNLPPALPTTPANLNVLPSPAPSDEPSPALSNPLDSPNPRTRPAPTAAQKQAAGQPQTVQRSLSPRTTWPSQPTPSDPAAAAATAAAGAVERTVALGHATSETPSDSARISPAMAPPNLPQSNQTGQVANVGNGIGSPMAGPGRAAAQSWSSATDEDRAGKRRRVECASQQSLARGHVLSSSHSHAASTPRADTASLTFAGLATFIDNRIAQQGGDQALQSTVEKARFHILRDACDKQDYFYLILHQLHCLWSVSRQTVSGLRLGDTGTISMGFEILDSVLKKNSGLSRPNLEWCANFPCQRGDLSSSPTVYNVATFLVCLANNWTALHERSFNRVCPYLMDEMIGKLQCYSIVLQGILFTASRRRLGVLDGPFGSEMDQLFRQDQQEHISNGQFQVLLSSDEPGELERRNQVLIQRYQQIISSAKQHEQEKARRQQQLLIQQQNLRNQQAQAQSPQQAAFQPNSLYEWQQNQVAQANHARRASLQTARPSNESSQRPIASPMMTTPHHIMNSPPIPQNAFSPPATGRQIGHVPPELVLQSSSAAAMPTARLMQSMPSPQAHTQAGAQGGLNGQQYGFGNHYGPIQNMQGVQYMNSYTQNMATVHQAAAQQHWPRERYILAGQQMPAVQFAGAPQYVYRPGSSPRPQVPQQAMANVPAATNWSQLPATFVPRPGQVIERSDWPHSHQDRKSLMMSLHQAQARSPDRTRRADEEEERHYQAVRSFAIEPFRLVYFHELELQVAPETQSLLCKAKDLPRLNGQPPASIVHEYTNGSLRYRLRCCRIDTDKAIKESDWVTKETSWPDYIFPHFNGEKLVVRRGTHHGKDLPVELTDFVVPGTNKLKVATMQAGPTADKIVRRFHLAVEVLETLSHSAILEQVWTTGVVDSAQTLEKVRKRIDAVPEEDGIAVIDRSGVTASELSIDLTDPFSASIFSIPARGSACTHMECFDLETWLNTRPIKQSTSHQHAVTCPKRLEPSEPDKWKCPICFGDARPRSLRIDSFLLGVRRQLEEQNKLDTKSILVSADGTWRPVIEPVDDEDAGSDGDGPISKGAVANLRKRPSKSSSVERAAVEIIELD